MQKQLDALEARIAVTSTAAAAGASVPSGGGGGTERVTVQAPGTKDSGLWGVRGPLHGGSLQNPITVVLAAGKYLPMGSQAAAVGFSNVPDQSAGGHSTGFATGDDMRRLSASIEELARASQPASRLAQQGQQGMVTPGEAPETTVVQDPQGIALL